MTIAAHKLLLLSGKANADQLLAQATVRLDPYNGAWRGLNGVNYASAAAMLAAGQLTYTGTAGGRTAFDRNGNMVTFATGVIRETNAGIAIEEARTNLYLNSQAAASQTVTLASTGTYVLFVTGSGSVTVAAGTVTATGYGTATAGNPVTLVVTVLGTVLLTNSGTPTNVDIQKIVTGGVMTPIITAGATVTRAIDRLKVTGLTTLFASPFTMMTVASLYDIDGQTRTINDANDATTSNRMTFNRSSGNNSNVAVTTATASQLPSLTLTSMTGARVIKYAGCLETTSFRGAINGRVLGPTTGISRPVLTQMDVGCTSAGGQALNGMMRTLAIWNRALTNAEMETLTQ